MSAGEFPPERRAEAGTVVRHKRLDLESGFFQNPAQVLAGIAAQVPHLLIDLPEEERMGGDGDDQAPVVGQKRLEAAQYGGGVAVLLQLVVEQDGVIIGRDITVGFGRVGRGRFFPGRGVKSVNLHHGVAVVRVFQNPQGTILAVGEQKPLPLRKGPGDRSDPGADLGDLGPEEGENHFGDSPGEVARVLHRPKQPGGVKLFGVPAVVDEPVLEDRVDRAETVFPADLFPLAVAAAVVADRDLVDGQPPLGDLGGDLRLDSETVAPQRDRLENLASERLVAGLHIGQIVPGGEVRKVGQKEIPELVVIEEDVPHRPRGETRSIDRVGVPLQKRR